MVHPVIILLSPEIPEVVTLVDVPFNAKAASVVAVPVVLTSNVQLLKALLSAPPYK
ncbi:MAG: hypothetical protein BWX95_01940 [Bacteroidetes bacterium ADurb.Bin141]|nr:hypothetical protein [Bacteroidia bacterium]OQB61291.1 MAG: hypothetical protein BWX95_01940 [Bacteroidetes bacterium ADurb.Bin141]